MQRQLDREIRAQEKADKLAAKGTAKTQSKLPKGNEKKSFIVILPYKKTSIGSIKAVTFAEQAEVVLEGGGVQNGLN
jgi:hypothetical protein